MSALPPDAPLDTDTIEDAPPPADPPWGYSEDDAIHEDEEAPSRPDNITCPECGDPAMEGECPSCGALWDDDGDDVPDNFTLDEED